MITTDPLLTALLDRHYVYDPSSWASPDHDPVMALYEIQRDADTEREALVLLDSWPRDTAPATVEDAVRSYYTKQQLGVTLKASYAPNTDEGAES